MRVAAVLLLLSLAEAEGEWRLAVAAGRRAAAAVAARHWREQRGDEGASSPASPQGRLLAGPRMVMRRAGHRHTAEQAAAEAAAMVEA